MSREQRGQLMLVTIGIPFYNSEETLEYAIKSVFAQTFQDWELILVDDGSTDSSRSIAQKVHDSRVRIVSDGVNHGLPYRLNQIASLARGKYIARLDADDLMHPERLERQIKYLEENNQVDIVGTGMYIIDRHNQVTGERKAEEASPTAQSVLVQCCLNHATITGKAEWFKKNSYNPAMLRAEDRELWCRTYQISKFAVLPVPLYYCRDGYSMTINIKNYLDACKTEYKIYKMYGVSMVGVRKTAFLITRTFIKSLAYRGLAALNLQGILLRRRNSELTLQELKQANVGMSQILQTEVQGL